MTLSPIGIFAFSDTGALLHYELFTPDPVRVAEQLQNPIPERFRAELSSYTIVEDETAKKQIRTHLREYAVDLGFVPDVVKLNEFLHDLGILLSKQAMGSAIQRDKLLIQAVQSLDDLSETLNMFYERMYEWFSLHYPEVAVEKKALVEQIATYGNRKDFPHFTSSLGVELTPSDQAILQEVAASLLLLAETRQHLEQYIKEATHELMKNVAALIDPLLATRLLAIAGSIEKLAKMPSSTIQLLGAEKALFRHLKKKGKSPKYGILYNSAQIQQAPDAVRGKVARILSAKLMIAARIDFYSGRDDTVRLVQEMKQELEAAMHEKTV